MAHSYRKIFMHFIWSTKGRRPILTGELEKFVHRRINEMAIDRGLLPICTNSAWDHIHTLMEWNTTTAFGEMVKDWKGRTFMEWKRHQEARGLASKLHWQDGCGIFSVSHERVERLKIYVANQKEHHSRRTTDDRYEWRRIRKKKAG